jgi:PAS domain S-box-containing protein
MTERLRAGHKRAKLSPPSVALPLTNSAHHAVIATDLKGKVVFWNAVAERIYGWNWQEALGQPITELVVPKVAEPLAEKVMQQLRKGTSWTGEIMVRRRDGTEFVAKVTDHPLQDNRGNLVGIIGVSQPKAEFARRPALTSDRTKLRKR